MARACSSVANRVKAKRYGRAALLLEKAYTLAEKAKSILDEIGEGHFSLLSVPTLKNEASVLREAANLAKRRA